MMHLSNQRVRGSAAVTLIGGIVILLATIYFLVKLATSGYYSDVTETTESATATRIMPQGNVTMGDGTPVGMREGEQIFKKVCIQCHGTDSTVAGAPKFGTADWAPRIAKGFDTLFTHALNGFNNMPAKGGASDLTDDELKRAIAYMANKSGANFQAPAVGGAAAAPASGAAASGAAASGPAASASAPAAAAPAADAGAAAADGKKVFEGLCMACHGATAAIPQAPKITKNDEWAPRIAKGKATLVKHAIDGFTGPQGGVMPPKGGNPSLTEAEISAAIVYMANQSGGNLK